MRVETELFVIKVAKALFIAGLGVLGYQAFLFLKEGHWISISVIDALVYFEIAWAINPSDWLGLYSILRQAPVSGSLVLSSVVTLWLLAF